MNKLYILNNNKAKYCLVLITFIQIAAFSFSYRAYAASQTVTDEQTLNQALSNSTITHIDLEPVAQGGSPGVIKVSSSLNPIRNGVSLNGHNSVLNFNGNSGFTTVANGNLNSLSNLTLTSANGPALSVTGKITNGLHSVSFTNNTLTATGIVFSVSGGLSGGINDSYFENTFAAGGANIVVTGDLEDGFNNTVVKHNAGADLTKFGGNVIVSKGHLTGGVNGIRIEGTLTYGNVGGALSVTRDAFNELHGGNLTDGVNNSYFINNIITRNPSAGDTISTSNFGGAIGINGVLSGGINDSHFIGNRAGVSGHVKESGYGGAISATSIEGGIHNSLFQDNSAASSGGAVFSGNNGAGTGVIYGGIHGSKFINNSAKEQGGAVQLTGLGLNGGISDSLFQDNTSTNGGGAIVTTYIRGGIKNSEFRGNKSNNHGGVMYVASGFEDGITGSSFIGNESDGYGGAFYVKGTLSGGVSGSLFEGNKSGDNGGAFYVNGTLAGGINNSTFKNNKASSLGGAVTAPTITGGINNSSFEGNKSESNGGAVYANSLTGGINGSTFENNKANGVAGVKGSGLGGALYLRGAVEINGGSFTNNSATTANTGDLSSGRGGAIFYDSIFDGDYLTLNALTAADSIYFSGNTHNVGGTGTIGNSIYFGVVSPDYYRAQTHVDFNLNVGANAEIVMLDALASQQEGLTNSDGDEYTHLTVDVTKNGAGKWILAGHNDMRADGAWLVSEGTLQFAGTANGGNSPVHIDLQHTNSSFTLDGGANLLVTLETSPHFISAPDITLDARSFVDLVDTINYSYVPNALASDYVILTLDGTNVQNDSQTGSGTIKIGIYDYDYTLRWDGNNLVFNRSQNGSYNAERAGNSAITAPGVMAFYSPVNAALRQRISNRFSDIDRLWAIPAYSIVSQKNGGGRVGYDLDTVGTTMGCDIPLGVGENAFVGVALSINRPYYRSGAAKYQGVETIGMVYGGVILPYNIELALFGGYGTTDTNLVRKVEGTKYHTDVRFDTLRAGAELGRRFALTPSFRVRPFASYEYYNVDVDGYNEGKGVYNLKVDSYRQEIQRAKVGLDVGYKHAPSGAYVDAQAYYACDFGDLKAKTDVAFTQDLSTKYKAKGNTLDKNVVGAGLFAGIPLSEKINFSGSYTLEYGKEAVSQQIALNIVFTF